MSPTYLKNKRLRLRERAMRGVFRCMAEMIERNAR